MQEWLFLDGTYWILQDPQEVAVALAGDGSLMLLLFSDEDLATTYAEKNPDKVGSKTAHAIRGNHHMLDMLIRLKALGVGHVAVDATPGHTANTATIDKAIQNVSQSLR